MNLSTDRILTTHAGSLARPIPLLDMMDARLKGQPIDPAKTYKIATTDFLMTGGERGIEFLNRQDPAVLKVLEHRDIRFAVIEEMKRKWK